MFDWIKKRWKDRTLRKDMEKRCKFWKDETKFTDWADRWIYIKNRVMNMMIADRKRYFKYFGDRTDWGTHYYRPTRIAEHEMIVILTVTQEMYKDLPPEFEEQFMMVNKVIRGFLYKALSCWNVIEAVLEDKSLDEIEERVFGFGREIQDVQEDVGLDKAKV